MTNERENGSVQSAYLLYMTVSVIPKRDRGTPHGATPPTPPGIRVRTRRLGGLIGLRSTIDGKPSAPKAALGKAIARAGLLLSRQGPCGLPAVCAARSRPT